MQQICFYGAVQSLPIRESVVTGHYSLSVAKLRSPAAVIVIKCSMPHNVISELILPYKSHDITYGGKKISLPNEAEKLRIKSFGARIKR